MKRFMISGAAVRQVVARAPRAAVSAERVREILATPGLSPTARQAMIDALFAGASVDLPTTHSTMPGIEIGAGLRANASQPRHASGHGYMPGIKIGGQAPRAHTGGRMPGLTLPVG